MKREEVYGAYALLEELNRLETVGRSVVRQGGVTCTVVVRGALGAEVSIPTGESRDLIAGRIDRRITHLRALLAGMGVET